MLKYILVIYILLLSCKSKAPKNCVFQDKSLDGKLININGCLKNSLEYGHWVYTDSIGNFLSEGDYDNGLLKGLWKYSLNDSTTFEVNWRKYENSKLNFYTNIPDVLSKVQEGDFFIKFQKSDTQSILNLVIAVHELKKLPFQLKDYYKQSESELQERGWIFDRSSIELPVNGEMFYMNFYNLIKQNEKRYVWNSYGPVNNGKVLEITANYDSLNDNLARIFFTSVISVIFLDNKRYLYPYRSID